MTKTVNFPLTEDFKFNAVETVGELIKWLTLFPQGSPIKICSIYKEGETIIKSKAAIFDIYYNPNKATDTVFIAAINSLVLPKELNWPNYEQGSE